MVDALTPELHQRLLDRYIADADADPAESRALAARYRLLPIFLDWVGFFGLTVEGQLHFVAWEPPHDAGVVREPHQARVALAAGAEMYPELAFLRPRRPPDAVPCPGCGGTGVVQLDGQVAPPNVICYCGGLGWVPPEEQATYFSRGA